MKTPLDDARVRDVALAEAAARGDTEAMLTIEAEHFGQLDAVLRRLPRCSLNADELRAEIRCRIFVGDTRRRPAIASYRATASLSSWIHLIGARLVLDALRRSDRRAELLSVHDELLLPVSTRSPELEVLRVRHQRDFIAAFRRALLSPPRRRGSCCAFIKRWEWPWRKSRARGGSTAPAWPGSWRPCAGAVSEIGSRALEEHIPATALG
jgi:DNA-directed RNA polymerase specialized sigma24 family protein